MIIKNTEKNYIDLLLEKAINRSNSEYLKKFDKIVNDFSAIKNEKSLNTFMVKYKIESESFLNMTFTFNQVYGHVMSKITFSGIMLLTGNLYLKSYFDIKDNIEEKSFTQEENVNFFGTEIIGDFVNSENNKIKESSNLIDFIEQVIDRKITMEKQKYLDNILNTIANAYKSNHLTLNCLEQIFQLALEKDSHTLINSADFMPGILNKLMSAYIEKGEASQIIQDLLKEKYVHFMKDKFLFDNLLTITGMNIKNLKFIYAIKDSNVDVFKKIIEVHSLKDFVCHYNDLVPSYSNEYDNNSSPLLFGQFGYYKTDRELEVLLMIIKNYDLQTITPDYKQMLDVFLTTLSSNDKVKMQEFLELIKEKYDYEYSYGCVYNNEFHTKVLPCSEQARGETFLLDYILKNRLTFLPEDILENLSMQIFHSFDINMVDKLFENHETKNAIYTIFLENFGNDNRRIRKMIASAEALEMTEYILSQKFINDKNITLSNKKIIACISKRNNTNSENEISIMFQKTFMKNNLDLIVPSIKSTKTNRL